MNGIKVEIAKDEVVAAIVCGDQDEGIDTSRHTDSPFLSNIHLFRPDSEDIPKCVSREVGMEAVQRCENAVLSMRALDSQDVLAPFDYEELVLGDFLGNGEFCDAYEIKAFKPSPDKNHTSLENEARQFLTKHAIREKSGDARYALKHLRPTLLASDRRFIIGAKDLALETQILASMQHPHIIKLRGLAAAGTGGFATGLNTGYFLILDRLNDTLRERLCEWAKKEKKYQGSAFKKLMDRKGNKRKSFMTDRLKVAFDISGALDHLHKMFIIYRDLKPDNLGFDIRGDIKLFDFGLAKEVPFHRASDNNMFKLSGAGSLRYMAPEVALGKPYNLKADVYSFSMLLWQILALKSPFSGYSARMYVDGIVIEGERPMLDPKWPSGIQNLLRLGWSPDSSVRPTMEKFYKMLRREVASLRDGDDDDLEHSRRRSTHILDSNFSL